MGFYNMAKGDEPILKDLALNYAISDNYHQAVQGGTGANHIALGTGFAASYQNKAGKAVAPPANEIENPNPKPGTNNNYTQDGYAGRQLLRVRQLHGSRASARSTSTWPRCPTSRWRTASRAATTC